MSVLFMNGEKVEDIARKFLSHNYDIIKIEKTQLVDKTWIVQIMVSSFGNVSTKKVLVSDKTGDIVGWS